MPQRFVAELVGKKVGDVVETQLSGNSSNWSPEQA
jgi:hypothetical protein